MASRLTFLIAFVLFISLACHASDNINQRYSFSLTTFDPSGKLGQVERAIEAAAKGTPVVAFIRPETILFASPQVLPSPLMEDDGTSRFVCITPDIMVAHSGLSADGRILLAAAQRMAVEHEYTFEEDIRIEIFLEEISLLLQEYTMKAAARPFGAVLVVAYMPSNTTRLMDDQSGPQLYRIDPSGSVQSLGNQTVVNGNGLDRTELPAKLSELRRKTYTSLEEDRQSLVKLLKTTLKDHAVKKQKDTISEFSILTASLSNNGHFEVQKHSPSSEEEKN